jgi:hypothetical protein
MFLWFKDLIMLEMNRIVKKVPFFLLSVVEKKFIALFIKVLYI